MLRNHSGQTITVLVLFGPKFCFGFGVSVISIFGDSADTLFWAKIGYFGQKLWKITFCSSSIFTKTCICGQTASFGYGLAKILAFLGVLVSVSAFWPNFCFV